MPINESKNKIPAVHIKIFLCNFSYIGKLGHFFQFPKYFVVISKDKYQNIHYKRIFDNQLGILKPLSDLICDIVIYAVNINKTKLSQTKLSLGLTEFGNNTCNISLQPSIWTVRGCCCHHKTQSMLDLSLY